MNGETQFADSKKESSGSRLNTAGRWILSLLAVRFHQMLCSCVCHCNVQRSKPEWGLHIFMCKQGTGRHDANRLLHSKI